MPQFSEMTIVNICVDLNKRFTLVAHGLKLLAEEVAIGKTTESLDTIQKLSEVVKFLSDDVFDYYKLQLFDEQKKSKR